jgi:hypothetical protein
VKRGPRNGRSAFCGQPRAELAVAADGIGVGFLSQERRIETADYSRSYGKKVTTSSALGKFILYFWALTT